MNIIRVSLMNYINQRLKENEVIKIDNYITNYIGFKDRIENYIKMKTRVEDSRIDG